MNAPPSLFDALACIQYDRKEAASPPTRGAARSSVRGLNAGQRIHVKGTALRSAENGEVVRTFDHPKRGTVVEYRPDHMRSTTRYAALDHVRAIHGPRL